MNELISHFLQSNLYLFVLWCCYRYGIKSTSNYVFARYFLLIGITISLLLPFLKISPISDFNSSISITSLLETVTINGNLKVNSENWKLGELILSIYAIACLFLLGKFFYSLYLIQKKIKISTSQGEYLELPNSTEAFSFFSYIFIGSAVDENERNILLEHEKVHLTKLHSIDVVFIQLVKIIFWMNPFIYKLNRELKAIHEFEADALSCKEEHNYIELLLKQNFQTLNFSLIHSFNSTQLKTRIMRLTTKTPKKVNKRAIALGIVAFGLIFLSNCTPEKLDPETPTTNNASNNTQDASTDSEALTQPETAAEYPGGINALYSFIGENLKYPENAKKNNISGTVFIQFIIDSKGKPKDFKVMRGVTEELDEAAIKVLKEMPQWKPAENKNKKVASILNIPIKYQLADD